jgi:two-component system chemotaxis sensor kinase CheA
MRCVLDNVDQGFLTIDKNGIMSSERSAIVRRWLGSAPDSGSLWEYIDGVAPGMGQQLQVAWEEVVSGFLPRELSLEQMPRRFSQGDRHFALEYKPISTSGEDFERAIVVLSDITPGVERERAEVGQRDALRLFLRLNEDRAGVLEFMAEAERLVADLTALSPPDPLIAKRLIHTLKGNASVFGIERLSRLCHAIEDTLAESNASLGAAEQEMLRATWNEIHAQLSPLTGDRDGCTLTVGQGEYEGLLRAVSAGESLAQIQRQLESWRLESTEVRLKRAARQAAVLAERLGKAPLEVHVESNQLRLDPELWSAVWTEFPHLIRNAIDHGLEDSAERAAQGKTGAARLCLRTFVEASSFVIEVEDSGRGVDWERVRAIANARGLATDTQSDLERALFADGLSTKECVGETSGRGIGMAAMAAAVHARGGQIQVRSRSEVGTRVRMSWPVAAAKARSVPAPKGQPTSKSGQ